MAHLPPSPHQGPLAPWARFARRYGWRAYAVVLLSVITAVAIVRMADPAGSAPAPATSHAKNAPVPAPAITRVLGLQPDSAPCSTNTQAQFVIVSISAQHAWMCEANNQVASTAVTTGDVADNDATPLGSWHVQDRQTNRDLTGPGYSDHVQYWVPFNGDFGFHDASWQTFPFGSDLYTTQGSHGCVHLPTPTMQWFYGWIQVGTLVTIAA